MSAERRGEILAHAELWCSCAVCYSAMPELAAELDALTIALDAERAARLVERGQWQEAVLHLLATTRLEVPACEHCGKILALLGEVQGG